MSEVLETQYFNVGTTDFLLLSHNIDKRKFDENPEGVFVELTFIRTLMEH